MTIEIASCTVIELHAQLQNLIERGLGDLPVVATDCRAKYPFQAYAINNQSGYVSEFLIYVRPDAHFAQKTPLPLNWSSTKVDDWNAEADQIKNTCGAFA